jgi:hypothetical protein
MLRREQRNRGRQRCLSTRVQSLTRVSASVCLALAALAGLPSTHAVAQNKSPSDQSVKAMMNYAWALMLPKFTDNGKEIVVDLDKPDLGMVPIDVAREIIRIGRLSANAQMCSLEEEQVANHQSMLARERAKAKWTPPQMMFINQLHLFTVMLMTGGVKVIERADGAVPGSKDVILETPKLDKPKADACNEAERGKVKEAITAYIAEGGAAKKP